jgi:large subunit ribosomal protein L13|tara:strand:+ start:98 stop:523 length:426 start_codon:yes stop_codon:yes gene_type:complete
MKTTLVKPEEVKRKWYIVDATDKILGRLSVEIADILRGKNKPTYTPHVDTGDYVVVINADKILLTGKKEEQKKYMFYTGYMGNEHYKSVSDFRENKPAFIIEHSVKGMLPKNKLAYSMIKKLKIYAGSDHPHSAQDPISLN